MVDSSLVRDTYRKEVKLTKEHIVEDNDQHFAVDLDSLLLDVFSNTDLDWKHGPSILQILYIAEKLLLQLQLNKRKFDLISFDAFEQCVTEPLFKLLRSLVVRHLQTQTDLCVKKFAGWWTPEFKQYCDDRCLAFVIISSGYTSSSIAHGFDDKLATYMQSFTLRMLADSVRVVRSAELEFGVTSITGYEMYLDNMNERKKIGLCTPVEVPVDIPAVAEVDAKVWSAVIGSAAVSKQHTTCRSINAYAVAKAVKSTLSDSPLTPAELAKLFLAHSLLLEKMPLVARAQALPSRAADFTSVVEKSILPFLSSYYTHANAAIVKLSSVSDKSAAILDILDGRLMSRLVLIVMSNAANGKDMGGLGFTGDLAEDLQDLWKLVATHADIKEPLFPICKATLTASKEELCLTVPAPTFLDRIELDIDGKGQSKVEAMKAAAAAAPTPKKEESAAKEESGSDVGDWEDMADSEEDGGDWEDIADSDKEEEVKNDDIHVEVQTERRSSGSSLQSDLSIHKVHSKAISDLFGDYEDRLEAFGIIKDQRLSTMATDALLDGWDMSIKFEEGINQKEEEEKKEKITDPKERRRQKRRRARKTRDMQKYAASLVGGKTIPRDVVVAAPSKDDAGKEKKSWAGKGGGGGKNKGKLSQKEITRLEVERKMAEKENENVDAWARAAQMIPNLSKKLRFMSQKMLDISRPEAAIKGHLKLLEWSTQAWQSQPNRSDQQNYGPAVHVFQLAYDIFRRFKADLSPADMKCVCEGSLIILGFEDSARQMVAEYTALTKNHVELEFPKEAKRDGTIATTSAQFQLQHAGHLMLRNVKSKKDDRVKDFYPDEWQRHLLDVVDGNESALVVAPTSSGKTFISYYAMRQTLLSNQKKSRISEKHFIVFVAPEKALVNQVAADVYRTFGNVYGTLLPTHHHRVSECEVLITVPEMLDVLLFSPVYEDWVSRINYVIFDEVHCLGLDDGGIVWERVLSMLKSPFLALSATLGNAEQFHGWLSNLSSTYGHKMNLIIHNTRWSDLQKYIYLPDRVPKVEYLNLAREQLDGVHITPIHPLSALSLGNGLMGVQEELPPMTLSPSESIELFRTMREVQVKLNLGKEVEANLAKLDPDTRFGAGYIGKLEAGLYEADLKKELNSWLTGKERVAVAQLLQSLSSSVVKKIHVLEETSAIYPYSPDFMMEHFVPALVELNAHDRLPAVVFCLNRDLCVNLALQVLSTLEEMEEKKHAEEERGGKEDDKARKAAAKAEKRNRDKKQNKKEAEEEAQLGGLEDSGPPPEDEYKVDPRFSFVKEGEHMNYTDLKFWLDRMIMRTEWHRQHPLVRALFRGIGVHHNGMPTTYKDLVETLFRGKHIKIVIATNTLAMGINMPCRTAFFAGNDKMITPLLYRQMKGRAGRRGYDDVGHVVFFGFAPKVVSRLMTSRLETLQGHYPIDATLVLRFINQYHFSSKKDQVVKKFKNILLRPYMKCSIPEKRQDAFLAQLRLHFRFSLEYFVSKGLLDPADGKPTGLAQLAMHLHEHSPANFVFVSLLADGTIGKICSNFKQGNKPQCARELLLLLCHLFYRRALPAGMTENPFSDDPNCPSQVVLDELPSDVAAKVEKHNIEAVDLFTHFLRVYSKSELAGDIEPACTLPISGTKAPTAPLDAPAGSTVDTLLKGSIKTLARSPFHALSGKEDAFTSAHDIAYNSREGIVLSAADVPDLCSYSTSGEALRLNAYALDFYKHGQKSACIQYNFLNQNVAWFMLKNWSNLINQITDAFDLMGVPEDNVILKTFLYIGEKFTNNMRAVNEMTHRTVALPTAAVTSTADGAEPQA